MFGKGSEVIESPVQEQNEEAYQSVQKKEKPYGSPIIQ